MSSSQEPLNKAVQLLEFAQKFASLRLKSFRHIKEYEGNILWISDICEQDRCFLREKEEAKKENPDIWMEVSKPPPKPEPHSLCKDWVDRNSNPPKLLRQRTVRTKNPEWKEELNQEGEEEEFIEKNEKLESLENRDKIVEKHEDYQREYESWKKENESIEKAYNKLFAIHHEQQRRGEDYELVLGLGLLTWKDKDISRHLIIANAILEFEKTSGKFIVRMAPDGSKLRIELDMLDSEDQPHGSSNEEENLKDAEDDPWNKSCVKSVLKALANSVSKESRYEETLKLDGDKLSGAPLVRYAPALILRKRSAKSFQEFAKELSKAIGDEGKIPSELEHLFGDQLTDGASSGMSSNDDTQEIPSDASEKVFFPKPSNEAQYSIVEKLRKAKGVVVQGPPGTGKSHTIANLICHLLANGQRVLVSAKKPRPLKVLEKLLPEPLRALCVNLHGANDRVSLEHSVEEITRKHNEWNEDKANKESARLESELIELKKQRSKNIRERKDKRESEVKKNRIAKKRYNGTVAQIAKDVRASEDDYKWFKDEVKMSEMDDPCLASRSDLEKILKGLRQFTPEKKKELILELPDCDERLADSFKSEKQADEAMAPLEGRVNISIVEFLREQCPIPAIEKLHDSLDQFQDKYQKLLEKSSLPWVSKALSDVIKGESSPWDEHHKNVQTCIEGLPSADADAKIVCPDECSEEKLLKDAKKLKDHLEHGGKLGFGPFRGKVAKECRYIFKKVQFNGDRPSGDELCNLIDTLKIQIGCKKAKEYWLTRGKEISEEIKGPYGAQLSSINTLQRKLKSIVSFEDSIKKHRDDVEACSLKEPDWIKDHEVERLAASCKVALGLKAKDSAVKEIEKVKDQLREIIQRGNAHPVVKEMLQAIDQRDSDDYQHSTSKAKTLHQESQELEKIDACISKMNSKLPELVKQLEETYSEDYWEERIGKIEDAWHWAQAKFWIEDYADKNNAETLEKDFVRIKDDISETTAQLAAQLAWKHCFKRMKDDHLRHMNSWRGSMGKLGKGTGRYAFKHRRDAQGHLNECREAIPATVMPLDRLWDTVKPSPEMFDVVIIDEASQCGIAEAIPLFAIAKKIVIVGDDKQINPYNISVKHNEVDILKNEYLKDSKFKSSFDPQESLFSLGKQQYIHQQISLREHFRCMPEIIRFSNNLCYSNTPLIPLRQHGSGRIEPLRAVYIEDGYNEGKDKMNEPEAEALVEELVKLCGEKQYRKKTMGVIVLQGQAQAKLIEEKLRERLDPEEMQDRHIICGNSSSFQGEERDIIFLSLVVAPEEGKPIVSQTKPEFEKIFNVAASRAKDQMYLFHSVKRNDLGPKCIRRKLLDFFEDKDKQEQESNGINLEKLEREARESKGNRMEIKATKPFDSWLEIDVALKILRKGFKVTPQCEFAGRRIDLVIEGAQSRLAVEVDGDHWHGPDKWDEDDERQRQLERCGWEFFRVKQHKFESDEDKALESLWPLLKERGIHPRSSILSNEEQKENLERKHDTVA